MLGSCVRIREGSFCVLRGISSLLSRKNPPHGGKATAATNKGKVAGRFRPWFEYMAKNQHFTVQRFGKIVFRWLRLLTPAKSDSLGHQALEFGLCFTRLLQGHRQTLSAQSHRSYLYQRRGAILHTPDS